MRVSALSEQRQPVGAEIEAGTLDLAQSGALEVAEGGSDRFAAGSHKLGEVTVSEAKLEAYREEARSRSRGEMGAVTRGPCTGNA